MKVKLLAAAALAAGLMFGAGGASNEAQAGVNFYFGVGPGYGYGGPSYYYAPRRHLRGHRHTHCHRYRVWRNGHRVWVRRCHRHSHGGGHHR